MSARKDQTRPDQTPLDDEPSFALSTFSRLRNHTVVVTKSYQLWYLDICYGGIHWPKDSFARLGLACNFRFAISSLRQSFVACGGMRTHVGLSFLTKLDSCSYHASVCRTTTTLSILVTLVTPGGFC